MLNDSYWNEYNDKEQAYLHSNDGELIAHVHKNNTAWKCVICSDLISEEFYWRGIDSIEEVEWKVTLYIYNRCNEIANQLHKIRDHLPSIHGLAEKAGITKILEAEGIEKIKK